MDCKCVCEYMYVCDTGLFNSKCVHVCVLVCVCACVYACVCAMNRFVHL